MTPLGEALWPRATLPRRPMLGAVLDALTSERDHRRNDARPSVLLRTGATSVNATVTGVALWVREEYGWSFDWITTDPAEAYELLQARGLIPMDCRSRFVCDRCYGSGRVVIDYDDGDTMACHLCDTGHRPHPPTVAALASWASLGFATNTGDDADDAHWSIPAAEAMARSTTAEPMALWRVGVPRDGRPTGGLPQRSPGVALWRAGVPAVYEGGERPTPRVTLYVPPLGLVTP